MKKFVANFTIGGIKDSEYDFLEKIHHSLQTIDPDFNDENLVIENDEHDYQANITSYSGFIIFENDDKDEFLKILHKWRNSEFFENYFSIDIDGKTVLTENTKIDELNLFSEYFFLYNDQSYIPF